MWQIGDFKFCQGCFLTYFGALIGFVAFLTYFNRFVSNALGVIVVVSLFLAPVLVVELLKLDNRPLKRTIRLHGGLGLGATLALALHPSLTVWVRVLSLGVAIVGYLMFLTVRKHGNTEDKCKGCDELEGEGVCSGYREEKQAIEKFNQYLEVNFRGKVEEEVSRRYKVISKSPTPSSKVSQSASDLDMQNVNQAKELNPEISSKLKGMIENQMKDFSLSEGERENKGTKSEKNGDERTQEAINQFIKKNAQKDK